MAKDFTMSFKMNVTGMEQVTSAIQNVESMSKRLNTQVNVMGEKFRKSNKKIHRVKDDMFQLHQGIGDVTTDVNVMGQKFGNATEKMGGMKKGMDNTAVSLTKGITQTAKLNDQIAFLRTPKIAETLGLNISKTGRIMDRTTGNAMSMDGVMQRMQRLPINKLNMLNQSLEDHNRKTKEGIQGVSRFKMEWLGVMFFGMAMAGFFMGLLQPAAQAYGIFDAFSIMLLVVFGPAVEMLMPHLLKFMDWMVTLPEPVQKAIGIIALIGFALGTFLFILGQMHLGITSSMKAFAWFGKMFQSVGLAIKAVSALSFGTILFWFIVIIAAVALLYTAWKNNWGNIREHTMKFLGSIWLMIKGTFDVIVGFVKIIFGLIVGIFSGNWDILKDGTRQALKGLVEIFQGMFQWMTEPIFFVWDLFKGFVHWLNTKLGGSLDGLIETWRMAKEELIKVIPDWMINLLGALAKGGSFAVDFITKGLGLKPEETEKKNIEEFADSTDKFTDGTEKLTENIFDFGSSTNGFGSSIFSFKNDTNEFGNDVDNFNYSTNELTKTTTDFKSGVGGFEDGTGMFANYTSKFMGSTDEFGNTTDEFGTDINNFGYDTSMFENGTTDFMTGTSMFGNDITDFSNVTNDFGTDVNSFSDDTSSFNSGITIFKNGTYNLEIAAKSFINSTFRFDRSLDKLTGNGLTKLATGGIVTSPTNALIGEAGPEAVIPLNKMGMIGGGAKTVNYAPTYNISAIEVRDELDKRALLNDLNDSNYNDLKQLNIR